MCITHGLSFPRWKENNAFHSTCPTRRLQDIVYFTLQGDVKISTKHLLQHVMLNVDNEIVSVTVKTKNNWRKGRTWRSCLFSKNL